MNKNRVALYLGGVLLLTVVMAVGFHKYSEAQTRSMASVAEAIPYFEQQPAIAVQQKVKEEFTIGCDAKEENIKDVAASSQVVRIKFNGCHQYTKKEAIYSVKNLTNGYDGQIFKNQEGRAQGRSPASATVQLSTDYIQLQSGENIIELEISLNDGQKINKKIRITRQ